MELQLIKTTAGFTPPVASRALGYTGVTLFESLVGGMKKYGSLQSNLGYAYYLPEIDPGAEYHWPSVANAAMKTIVNNLFPNTSPANKVSILNLYNELQQAFNNEAGLANASRSTQLGENVALTIFEWSKTDGGHQSYMNNTPVFSLPVFPGAWIPTPPAFQAVPVQAYWGNNRPFLAGSTAPDCIPPPPPIPYSTTRNSPFYKEAMEVYNTSKHLNQERNAIALYWADGGGTITPPGHTVNIATQMIRTNNIDLEDAAMIYAKMGMAVADAFIACWKGKYAFNVMRPITYIRENIDPTWNSLIATPPFPTYCSGHATVSGASAEVLTELFGDKNKFTDRTHEQTFGVRTFKSFYHAAEEAAISRLYGGIHFRMDNEIGLEKGKTIGKNIARINLKR